MNISQIEVLAHQFSELLMTPVLLVITLFFFYVFLLVIMLFFFYAFLMLSGILKQYFQRRHNNRDYIQAVRSLAGERLAMRLRPVQGYRLFSYYQDNPHKTANDLEAFVRKELERQRIVARVAVMLGLVSIMIALGVVLKTLAGGNFQSVSENIIITFAAVTFGLITAAITLWVFKVKKHWFTGELNDLQMCLTSEDKKA